MVKLLLREGVSGETLSRVDDVKLEVYHMNNLSREVRSRFVSDLGFVTDFLNEGGFESRLEQKIVHPEALCEMMKELTGDTRFTDLVEDLLKRQAEGKEIIMCEYIDMLEARGEARGIKIGEATGENRMAKLMQRLLREKITESWRRYPTAGKNAMSCIGNTASEGGHFPVMNARRTDLQL